MTDVVKVVLALFVYLLYMAISILGSCIVFAILFYCTQYLGLLPKVKCECPICRSINDTMTKKEKEMVYQSLVEKYRERKEIEQNDY